MTVEPFRNLVIGDGVAGKLLARILAKQGQKTVVIERSMVGGSCPNVACLPRKNGIHSAKAVSLVHPTAYEGLLGLFATHPSAPAPEPPASSRSVNGGRQASTAPATAKE